MQLKYGKIDHCMVIFVQNKYLQMFFYHII